jgi:Flp pilus assembly protein TadG
MPARRKMAGYSSNCRSAMQPTAKPLGLHRSPRKGAVAIEFAILAPIFLMLLLGMIDFSRTLMVQSLLNDAARQGARAAALDGATSAEVTTAVRNTLQQTTVDADTVTAVVEPSNLANVDSGDPVTVRVSVPLDDVLWTKTSWFLGGQQLQGTMTWRHE